MNSPISSIALAALTLMAPYSLAQAEDMVLYATQGYIDSLRTKDMMHMIDANKDGKVSRDEWIAYQERLFVALDKDKDGFLETTEFFGAPSDTVIPYTTASFSHGLMTQQMFGKIDANGDGKLSKDEFVSYQTKIFDMMDTHKMKELGVADFIIQKPSN